MLIQFDLSMHDLNVIVDALNDRRSDLIEQYKALNPDSISYSSDRESLEKEITRFKHLVRMFID